MLINNYITANCSIAGSTVFKNEQQIFSNPDASLQEFLVYIYQQLKVTYPKFYKMDNLSKLGWLASEVLLQNENIQENYQAGKIGLVIANCNSSLDNDLKYHDTISEIPSPSVFVYTLPNIVIGEICIRNKFKGEQAFFLQETFDAAFMHSQVAYLLNHGILDACICGWVDVLGEEYKATLFLIEKKEIQSADLFTPANMNRIFNRAN
ncbi:hypothetical protein A0256_07485 [Mucilaginibacter sp. PAMC 26640]|nr:hypothetical protein A0256_07485 [Mucilaginibacter sp. PAMC 26640]